MSRSKGADRAAGFSLVELLAVLAILALAAGAMAPRIGAGLDAARARDAALETVQWLGGARQRAMRGVQPVTIRQTAKNTLSMGRGAGSLTLPHTEFRLPGPLRFDPAGGSDGGWVDIKRPGHPGYRLSLDRFLGTVSIAAQGDD
ncbi:MAG: prepilin-type N-terminal cleavage/methylation domain-containing protein [Pseudomonadota bacterium]